MRKIGLKKASKITFIGRSVELKCKNKIKFGIGVTIQDHITIDALSRNGIYLKDGASIGRYSVIRCSDDFHELRCGFYLGNNSSLADNCFVGVTGGVHIGDNVIEGPNIRFHASNHCFNRTDINIKEQGVMVTGIQIGNNCRIGASAVFCDRVSIGNGYVIGAKSGYN